MNADSLSPENTWQLIFKSYSNQHHGFVDSIEQAMVLLKKYELETTTKFPCYNSDKLFRSGGKAFFTAKVTPGHVGKFLPLQSVLAWSFTMYRASESKKF